MLHAPSLEEVRNEVQGTIETLAEQWMFISKDVGWFLTALGVLLWHVTPTKIHCVHFWMPIALLTMVGFPFLAHLGQLLIKVGKLKAQGVIGRATTTTGGVTGGAATITAAAATAAGAATDGGAKAGSRKKTER